MSELGNATSWGEELRRRAEAAEVMDPKSSRARILELEARVKELEKDLDATRDALEGEAWERQQVVADRDRLQNQVEDLDARVAELQGSLADQDAECLRLAGVVDRLREELKATIADLEYQHTENDRLREENNHLREMAKVETAAIQAVGLARLRAEFAEVRRVIRNSREASNVLDTLDFIARRALEGSE